MKRFLSFLFGAITFFTAVYSIFAWGGDGHQTVGRVASLRIKPGTAIKISQVLRPGETLANISTWADTVKERVGKTDPDPDTNAFLQDVAHNEKNREWHYVNLPLNCRSYQTCNGFTLENDIVHMLNVSIRTLQGHPSPKYPLSKRNALKLLVHLVGDIHQPLHVGAGFIDAGGSSQSIRIVRDPVETKRKNLAHDRGGNDLVMDKNRKNLHSFWDFDLIVPLMDAVALGITTDIFGDVLRETVRPQTNWNSGGPVSTWAAQWATDSLRLSRNHTYKSVVIVGKRTIPVLSGGKPVISNGQPVMQTVYDISRSTDYETVNREIVRQQLAKAGYRLAKLLDAIYAQ